MRKFIAFMCIFMTILLSLCAATSKLFFPNLSKEAILPIETDLGQLCSVNDSEEYSFLDAVLKEEFSFEWTQKYLSDFCREPVTNMYSAILADLLPSKEHYFSKPKINGDGSKTVSVKFIGKNQILVFAVKNNSIVSLTY